MDEFAVNMGLFGVWVILFGLGLPLHRWSVGLRVVGALTALANAVVYAVTDHPVLTVVWLAFAAVGAVGARYGVLARRNQRAAAELRQRRIELEAEFGEGTLR